MHVTTFTGTAGEWDGFVRSAPSWTHFHLHGWKPLIETVFGHECIYLEARDDGRLAGALPLVRVKSVAFGHYVVSMPFLNYGGPLGTDGAVTALVGHAVEIGQRDRVKLLEMRCRHENPAVALPVSHRKITVLLDLPASRDGLWKRFDSKLRSQIKRPRKEGVTVRFGADQVEPFYTVFSRHMRDLGTPAQPKRLFTKIAETFPEDSRFGCAYLGDQPVACGAGFRWGAEFEMTWAASLQEHKRTAANMLLYAAFMENAVDDGVAVFNFGRCTPGSGTHKFKLQWGGRDEKLWWYGRADGISVTPTPSDPRFAWGPRLWKHLPLPLARTLGPLIVRSIP